MSLFTSTKASERSKLQEVEQLLYLSINQEQLAKETISSLLSQLTQKQSAYPVFAHPKVKVLLNALNVVMAVLKTYEAHQNRLTPNIVLNMLKEQLSDMFPSVNSIKEEEALFIERLEKQQGSVFRLPQMEQLLEKWEITLEQMKETMENIRVAR